MRKTTWKQLLPDGEKLLSMYSDAPPVSPLNLRSAHLSRYGPSVTIRADLMSFPDRPPPEWAALGLDTLQVHVTFLAVDDLALVQCALPALVSVSMDEIGQRRMLVELSGGDFALHFTSSDTALVGHVSAYLRDGLIDDGPHRYLGKLDQRLYSVVPDPTVKAYHDHNI
jgi:non-ribosomal peptide synthetase component F